MRRKHTCENDVKADVKELLTKYGWTHWANSAGPHSVPGIEDRSALRRGMFLAVESKFGKRELTVLQQNRLDAVAAAGGYVWVARETNLEAFEMLLKNLQ